MQDLIGMQERKWLIIGTGPSSELVTQEIAEKHNVVTLNRALCYSPVSDMTYAFFNHMLNAEKLYEFRHKASKFFTSHLLCLDTPGPGEGFVKAREHKPLTEMYGDILEVLDISMDFPLSATQHLMSDYYYCRRSVSTLALSYLFKHGVKEVLTAGIDGGDNKIADNAKEFYDGKRSHVPYCKALAQFKALGRVLGVKITRLNDL